MTVFYSANNGGFYHAALRAAYEAAGTWPQDCIEISDNEYLSLLSAQDAGKQIIKDGNGRPVAVTPPPPSDAQLELSVAREKALRLDEAARQIAPLEDAIELGMATDDEKARLLLWRQYRIAVSRIDDPAFQQGYPHVTWPLTP